MKHDLPEKKSIHIPVLASEVIELLRPEPGGVYVDATVNGGGHAREILKHIGARGRLFGVDWDLGLIERTRAEAKKEHITNLTLIHGNYRDIENAIPSEFHGAISGILFDLGYSSYHIDFAGRGFSFRTDEPLDMRYDIHDSRRTAENIINRWPEDSIANALRVFGEERFSRQIARAIVEARRKKAITSTSELVKIIEAALPRVGKRLRIHPATRTFQALRIAVNEELVNVEKGLAAACRIVRRGGRVAVISFHSLEDRIAKNVFRELAKKGAVHILTKKPIFPSHKEISNNPRARSARLRAIERIS